MGIRMAEAMTLLTSIESQRAKARFSSRFLRRGCRADSVCAEKQGRRSLPTRFLLKPFGADGARQSFGLVDRGDYLESLEEVPEPHAFIVYLRIAGDEHSLVFEEHDHAHGNALRDNNMRAAVSVLVIVGLILARAFRWLWMNPLAGIIGACVIASWSYGLIRNTGAILLDMNPDRRMANNIRQTIEADGDRIAYLHLWRLGPGHLDAIVSVDPREARGAAYYRAKLLRCPALSHLTIEVRPV